MNAENKAKALKFNKSKNIKTKQVRIDFEFERIFSCQYSFSLLKFQHTNTA